MTVIICGYRQYIKKVVNEVTELPPVDLKVEYFEMKIVQPTRAVLPFYIKDHERNAVTWRLDLFLY